MSRTIPAGTAASTKQKLRPAVIPFLKRITTLAYCLAMRWIAGGRHGMRPSAKSTLQPALYVNNVSSPAIISAPWKSLFDHGRSRQNDPITRHFDGTVRNLLWLCELTYLRCLKDRRRCGGFCNVLQRLSARVRK